MWADEVGDDCYTWDRLLPYFEKSVNFTPPNDAARGANVTTEYDASTFGSRGPLRVSFPNYAYSWSTWIRKGLAHIGIKPRNGFTSGGLLGQAYYAYTMDRTTGTRDSSETAFLAPAIGRPSLTVYLNTLARRILFDASKTARGVQVQNGKYLYTLSARREVILSAGAFQSPQLLMVSGVGPRATLEKFKIPVLADRPGVGQNMWDHVFFGISYRVNLISVSALGDPAVAADATVKFLDSQSGLLSSTASEYFGWEKLPAAVRANFSRGTRDALARFPPDWPEVEYLCVASYLGYQSNYLRDAPTDGYNYATLLAALITPSSRGSVSIASSDTNDAPLIDPNFLAHPADRDVVIAAFKRVREALAAPELREILVGPEYFPGPAVQTDEEIFDWIKKSFNSVWHAAATCKMGKADDPMAVVDSTARVIGVKGLRVVDASAFPLLPPGHPQATVYMLAEKIADDIKSAK